MKKARWKLLTYVPFLAVIVIIGIIQSFMLANENVKPYPEPFGRATELPQLATYGEPVQMIGDGSFTYLAGKTLQIVTIDEEGRQSTESRPLPDVGVVRTYKMIDKDHVIWIGDSNKLYESEWKSGSWSSKNALMENEIVRVQTVVGPKGNSVILAYNDSSLYVSEFHPNAKLTWTTLDIANVKQVHGVWDTSGDSLSLVYAVSKDGSESFHYAKLAEASWKPLVQIKLKDVDYATSSLDDMALGVDGSTFMTAYTTSSRKSGKSTLHMLTFTENQPNRIQDEVINLPVTKGNDSDTILHPTFTHSTSGEVTLVASSVYEKNRRQTSQEVYKISFKDGKMLNAARISQFGGFSVYPIFAWNQGSSLAIWLDAVNADTYRVYYTTDQLPYAERMNSIHAEDYQQAAGNLPLFWGIGVLTALISLKWILLPGLYLIVMSVFWQYHYDEHAKRHFGISMAMYLVVKALFIGDYRKPIALQVMPDFLQSVWVSLILLLLFAAISYGLTRLWRKGLSERNVGLEMFYFVVLDVFMTNMWYSFFMSPATLS
ncbi:hypothetical protein PAECIP111891_00658 [Paenibacillus allorhizoplanae]|uniref:WD40 repeat domain-containing protein n=1 Tax=Paenibacillus allorhizoplanae TaxID=2905648 RepID=A0ABM9BVB7_9BACL|nr:hypothetical protein [Paenibacillus allorhizoplanae]CAH1195349.1 hypothetical protein PAECIP111891_00658 [Paenibacillus allorhizoplanae]